MRRILCGEYCAEILVAGLRRQFEELDVDPSAERFSPDRGCHCGPDGHRRFICDALDRPKARISRAKMDSLSIWGRVSGMSIARTNVVQAVVYEGSGITVRRLPAPRLASPLNVRIRVTTVGLCRTDLHVASGLIAVEQPRILGHEFAGRIVELGHGVAAKFKTGDQVSANPLVPSKGGLLQVGVELDGALATEIVLPASQLTRVSDSVAPRHCAYLEPLAAAMAPLSLDLPTSGRGFIPGDGRISILTRRAMRAAGFLQLHDAPEVDAYDFAIETGAHTIAAAVTALKPGGVLILKSRPHGNVALPLRDILFKQLTVSPVLYGDFDIAADWLANGTVLIEDLFGQSFSMNAASDAFSEAGRSEANKVFIEVSDP
ncbi:MAG: threonine dehydrogenase-like Zn-dependent dehydrogenase [Myxococcota bacterium]